MGRITQAQAIGRHNEEHALAFFESTLGALPDHRRAQGKPYPLRTVVVVALIVMVCGSHDAEVMKAWGDANAEWLATFLPMPHGTPPRRMSSSRPLPR
jgi:hypothetical protein